MKDNSMKIRIAERETCWAKRLSDNLAQINNIPMDGKFNLHDIVEYEERDGQSVATKIVSQGYSNRSYLQYDEEWQFHRLNAIFKMLGCSIEGMIGPSKERGSKGYMTVAHDKSIKPLKIAEGMGISQKKSKES
jgi:hypothetical protein